MLDPALKSILDEASQQMDRSIEHLATELSHLRAGRATPSMVEDVRVEAYGSQMPLNQVASVNAPQSDLIVIQPWDKGMLPAIEKAIMAANLGFNPSNDGQLIRIALPPLTEERRAELAKAARARGEEAKVSVRNVRKSAKDQIKKTQQSDSLPEDMRYEAEDKLQTLTDNHGERIDGIVAKKETEIMKV